MFGEFKARQRAAVGVPHIKPYPDRLHIEGFPNDVSVLWFRPRGLEEQERFDASRP